MIYSFAACPKFRAIFESYTLQTWPVHLSKTNFLTLYVWVHLLRIIENAKLASENRTGPREWKTYKRQLSQRQMFNCSLSTFVSFRFSLHIPSGSSLWHNQWPSASHFSKQNFFDQLCFLIPIYNGKSKSILHLWASAFFF